MQNNEALGVQENLAQYRLPRKVKREAQTGSFNFMNALNRAAASSAAV
jgi:hypothetical protein